MKHNDCRDQDLVACCYGDLDLPARARLEAHLKGCPACRERLAATRQLLDGIPQAGPDLAPADLDRFAARVAARVAARSHRRAGVWGGALATAAVLAGILLLRGPGSPPEVGPLPPVPEVGVLSELDLLQDLDLLENLEWLQELEGTG